VGAVVHGHELVERNVRVALSRRKTRVPEQLLDGAQIGATLEQVRRAGVSESVRVQIAAPGAKRSVALNERLDAPHAEPRAVSPEK
jgi:hypothetical protein